MPSQARDNSWTCDYCGTEGFPSFDDARDHEQECQESARKRPRTRSPSDENTGIAPLSAAVAAEMSSEYDPSPRPRLRRYTIMASGDMNRYQLDRADALACQNIEVFEAGSEFEGESRMGPVVAGQVGIRCLHCAEQPTDGYSMYFPGSIEALAQGIQMVADRHVAQCPAVPEQLREDYQYACDEQTRGRDKSRSAMDEERRQMAMNTYCTMFCRNCGIVNKYPPQSGMAFYHTEQQQYGPTLLHPRDADVQYPPSVGQRPPSFQSMVARMGDEIAPTPLARSSKDLQDRGPPPNYEQGYSGLPTPYASGQMGMYQEGMGAQTPYIRPGAGYEGPTPQQQGYAQDSPFPGYEMSPYAVSQSLQDFPFFQDSSSAWSCKFCSGTPPQYRDQGATWNGSDLPPTQFIAQHLQACRSYNQVNMPPAPPQGMPYRPPHGYGYQGPPPPSYGGYSPSQGPPGGSQPMPYYSTGHAVGDSSFGLSPDQPDDPRPRIPPPSLSSSGATSYPRAPRGRAMDSPMPSRRAAVGVVAAQQAIDYLVAAEQEMMRQNPAFASTEQLVLEEDKILLTDYFYFLMKQLRVCRFAETDRKTRGGKRENIAIGYGGLQCIHCAEATNARKFFWSNVDRLANSFAEIPAHVLKCRRCPNQTKTAIMDLKSNHPEQMAKLPRGSQKVFFRRMWRRLHDADPTPGGESPEVKESDGGPVVDIPSPRPPAPPQQQQHAEEQSSPSAAHAEGSASSPGTSTDESALFLERPTDEAAKALAASMTHSDPPSPSSRVLLGIPEDKEWLSDMDCFIRRNLEVFCATAEDVEFALQDRKYPITVGQVGIRCIHCALAGGRAACRGNAIAFPYSINGIYEGVREFQRLHLESCPNLPPAMRQKLEDFKGSSSLSSVLRKYYVLAANSLGMYDTPDGIRSGGESVPVRSSAAFAFTDDMSVAMRKDSGNVPPAEFIDTGPARTPSERRKRKQPGKRSVGPPADAKPAAA